MSDITTDSVSEEYVPPDGTWLPDVETYVTGTGQRLRVVHDEALCERRSCVVHNPSEHSMREFPTHWRQDRGIMERICPHGVGHSDPDDLIYLGSIGVDGAGIHGCDGCCSRDREACPKCKGYDEDECTCSEFVKALREQRGRD